ncbi:MAG TPA: dockerin type I domain-containing protein, partial [Candidatus Solibacter sp.]|nr:dockerin type I domain-containing protein [Candidatus Solibacter sp.]
VQAVYNGSANFAGSSDSTHNLIVTNPLTVVSFNVMFGTVPETYNVTTGTRNRLPWQVTGIQVVFSAPITSGDQSSLTGVTTTGFNGLGTNTLTWSISPISLASVSAMLAGSGTDALQDSSGNGLNGGAGFTQAFKVLWGDFNDDGVVNAVDGSGVNGVRNSGVYNPFADMNGDGVVDAADVNIVRTRLGTSLP